MPIALGGLLLWSGLAVAQYPTGGPAQPFQPLAFSGGGPGPSFPPGYLSNQACPYGQTVMRLVPVWVPVPVRPRAIRQVSRQVADGAPSGTGPEILGPPRSPVAPGGPVAPGTPGKPGIPGSLVASPGVGVEVVEGGMGIPLPDDLPPVPPKCPRVAAQANSPPNTGTFYASADYLLWHIKKAPLPEPLVSTGPEDVNRAGAVNSPGTVVLLGGPPLDYGQTNGYRLTAGSWLDEFRTLAFEGSWFQMEQRAVSFQASSDANGEPILGHPLINSITGNEVVFRISSPGEFTGSYTAVSRSRLQGWEANLVRSFYRDGLMDLDFLMGFRQLNLTEDLRTTETNVPLIDNALTFGGEFIPAGDFLLLQERFQAINRLYGPQLGVRYEVRLGPVALDFLSKIAVGWSEQTVNIGGGTAVQQGNTILASLPGATYAQLSNIGHYYRAVFAVAPEFGVTFSVQVAENVFAHVGYSFIYWNSVIRPGSVIDRTVNLNLPPSSPVFGLFPGNQARPQLSFETSELFASGLNVGLEVAY